MVQAKRIGGEARFWCSVQIVEKTSWLFNDRPLLPSNVFKTENIITIREITKENAGHYQCIGVLSHDVYFNYRFSAIGVLKVAGKCSYIILL